eukprot:1596082-Pleurochrysis_carterae.AAC.1
MPLPSQPPSPRHCKSFHASACCAAASPLHLLAHALIQRARGTLGAFWPVSRSRWLAARAGRRWTSRARIAPSAR